MSEKYDNLFNELKSKHLISLYHERVMFYNDGTGEIQFWKLEDVAEDTLVLKNKGVQVFFNSWEFEDSGVLHVFRNENEVAAFKFPSEARIATNHNYFYVEEFTVEMSAALQQALPQKGDWADCTYQQVIDLLKKNVGNLDAQKDIKKSCIDIANFAMMAYYLG